MDPKQHDSKRNEDETIQDVSADEAEKVAGGGLLRSGGFDDPEPPPPTNDGTLIDI
jgi:hypothetical protein